MRYGHFDDDRAGIRDHPTRHAAAVDQLPRHARSTSASSPTPRAGTHSIATRDCRRLTRYRYNNAPSDTGGRYLYLRDDRTGDYWSPSWQPTQRALDSIRVPSRPVVHEHCVVRTAGSTPRRPYFVPLGETLEVWRLRVTNQRRRTPRALAVLVGRVLSLGRAGRRDQLPAQPLHRRGRGRGRCHLSQDRISRAPDPLRLFRVLRTLGRGSTPTGRPSSARTAGWIDPLAVERGEIRRLDRARLGAARVASRDA